MGTTCGSAENLNAGGIVTWQHISGTPCPGSVKMVICFEWIDCDTGEVGCSNCTSPSVTVTNGTATWVNAQVLSCNPGAGTWQLRVRAIDATGLSSGGVPCSCSDGCTPGSPCDGNMDCTNKHALAASCCIQHS